MRISRALAVLLASSVAATAFAVATPGAAFANDDITSTAEVSAAITKLEARGGSLIAKAAPSLTDADSAAQTATVDIPADPTKDVVLTAENGQAITIGLPGARQSGKGQKTRSGAVAFGGKDCFGNAALPAERGAQFLTVIECPKAPMSYTYEMSGIVSLTPEGGALIANNKGAIVAAVPPAWAKDANGKDVRSYFTTDGKNLTQVVDHRARGIAYPVVADPIVIWVMGLTVYCFIAGSWEARNIARNSPWYMWIWGMFVACMPL